MSERHSDPVQELSHRFRVCRTVLDDQPKDSREVLQRVPESRQLGQLFGPPERGCYDIERWRRPRMLLLLWSHVQFILDK